MTISPSLLLILPLVVPLVTAPVAWRLPVRWSERAQVIGSSLLLAAAWLLAWRVFTAGPLALDGLLYADALSALLVAVVALVGWGAAVYGVGYLRHDVAEGRLTADQPRWFALWYQLFLLTMLAVLLAENLGAMWVAVEATTLASALLVGFYRTERAVEAAWKYLLLCTVGITLALFGVLLVYYAGVQAGGTEEAALSWRALVALAPRLNPDLVKLAFIFALVGYGTKAGFAPLHTWLPDAHSQAPTPVSAVLSGVLLPCALYAILRFHAIASGALGPAFSSNLLVLFGVLTAAEGRTPDQTLPLAERLCGACALSHAVAFCEAVEGLAAADVPPRASWGRTVLLELERLYNHLGDAGNICAGTGFAVGVMQGALLKEHLQQLNERLVGHRFLRGACAVGGLRRDLDAAELAAAGRELRRLHAETRTYTHLLVEHDEFVDRLRGTGRLDPDTVRALGGVGPAARAAGVDTDLRRDRPHAGYAALKHALHIPLHQAGDVEARLRQRLAEAAVSFRLLEELLANPPGGPIRAAVGPPAPHRLGLGAVESPRGADVHAVLCDAEGRIARYRVRSASFPNWPLVPLAVPGNLMPDFPLINKSFELCYACLDR